MRLIRVLVALSFCLVSAQECSPEGMMTKVVVSEFDAANPIETLDIVNVPIPAPADDEVLIHMRACPINPADTFSIMGVYPSFAPPSLPATPGLEGMGVVVQSGDRARKELVSRGIKLGSRVVPLHWEELTGGDGSFSEYLIAKVDNLIAVHESVSDVAAAQLLVNPLTVFGMLQDLSPPPGAFILQAAGGSTLGKQLIQVAKAKGFKTISTVRRCEQEDELKAYGADFVICTGNNPEFDSTAIASKVMEITEGAGAWGAVDPVAGNMTAALQDSVRPGGKVLVYGALSGLEFKGSVVASLFKGVTVQGFWVTPWIMGMEPAARRKQMTHVMKFMASKKMDPHVGKTFRFSEVKAAFTESNRAGRSSDGKALFVTPAECLDKAFSVGGEL